MKFKQPRLKEAKPQQMPEGRAGAALWTRQPGGGQRACGLAPVSAAQGWRRAPASCLGSVFPSVGPPARRPRAGEGAGAEAHECQVRAVLVPERAAGLMFLALFFFFNHLMTFGLMSVLMVFAALSS